MSGFFLQFVDLGVSIDIYIIVNVFRFQLDSPEQILVKGKGEEAKSKSRREFRFSSSY